jgi:hypothetical protein
MPNETTPKIHRFSDASDAYNASQTRDEIRDGDVLLVEREGARATAAVLVGAWPTSVGNIAVPFHSLREGHTWETLSGGRYAESAKIARSALDGTIAESADVFQTETVFGLNDYRDMKWAATEIGSLSYALDVQMERIAFDRWPGSFRDVSEDDESDLVVVDEESGDRAVLGRYLRTEEDAVVYETTDGSIGYAPVDCVSVALLDPDDSIRCPSTGQTTKKIVTQFGVTEIDDPPARSAAAEADYVRAETERLRRRSGR